MKTGSEFVGFVREDDGEFEIWERRAHAVHAKGSVRGRRGGTRLELRFVLSGRTVAFLAIFAILYVAAAYGITVRSEGPLQQKLVVWILGTITLSTIFALGARNQRAALRSFIEGLFRDVEDRERT